MLNACRHFGLSEHAYQLSFKMRPSNSFDFALFLLLLREKHGVFLLICLFLLITKVFIKFKQILFDKNIRLCTFKIGSVFTAMMKKHGVAQQCTSIFNLSLFSYFIYSYIKTNDGKN